MSGQSKSSHVLVYLLAFAFGALRAATVHTAPPLDVSFFTVFKDLAHVFVGATIGAALAGSHRDLWVTAGVITAIECVCAAVTIFGLGGA